ncbi:MAG: radical SAM protein [Gemmatimonadales bacterium]|nr:radical SAM protein [Gemmatimonadales bacterium]
MSGAVRRQLPLFESAAAPTPWETLDERDRGTRFVALPVRSVLNPPSATGMGFWSVNPYIGCEFGCTYCYARDTHRYAVERAHDEGRLDDEAFQEFRGPGGWEAFERRILVKRDAPAVLARTLEPARLAGYSLVIGTATDPYQPAERRFRLTRGILEVLLAHRGLTIGIITKSPLVTRDIDVLARLSERNSVSVHVSLATADARLARRLEPRTPVPSARLRALQRLRQAGIRAGILIAPILPGINDDVNGLSALLAEARARDAQYAVGSSLRLGPAARNRFLPFLDSEFPVIAARYRRHYASSTMASPAYRRALHGRLERLQREHGFDVDEGMREEREWRQGVTAGDVQVKLL